MTLITGAVAVHGQTPSTCFEIESILVDACGNPEGENEMVLFHVGPNALNTANLSVNWPNNGWLGICQNATTAAKVAQLNATIVNCGHLLEPSAGVLPAGARVLLITSTNFSTAANSFAGLSDTLYVIFQCAGNTAGHFANATGSGNRTLSMTFSSPAGCTDAVTYNCQSLVDIYGNTGTSGPSTDRDGSTVDFAWGGTPFYTNDGCNAPYAPLVVSAGSGGSVCQGDTVVLNGSISGNVASYNWGGGNGTYLNSNTLTPSYVVSPMDNGTIAIVLTAVNCNGPIRDTIFLTVNPLPNVGITPAGPITLCQGNTQLLTATGNGPFTWSTGQSGNSITVSNSGVYYVSATNSCGTDTAFITVNSAPLPVADILQSGNVVICTGSQVTLNATGSGTITWTGGSTGNSFTTGTAGMVYATVTNSCGTATDSLQITLSNTATVNITPAGPVSLCAGDSVQLVANGSGSFSWNTGATTASVYVNTPGTYIVTLTSSCGVATDTVQVLNNGTAPVASVNPPGAQSLCPGQNILFTASGGNTYAWSNGENTAQQTISSPGNYWVAVSNACGSDTAFITVNAALAPQAVILQGGADTLCQGQSLVLSASGNGSLYWSTGQTGNSIQVGNPGVYFVIDSNACGADTAFFQLTVIPVLAQFTADSLSGSVPLTVQFTNGSQGAASYTWNFGDGGTSTNTDPDHTFTTPGDYPVVLVAISNQGCSDTATLVITVDSCDFHFYIPNTFTPNHDATNDAWKVFGTCVDQLRVYIYNRWGEEIYDFSGLPQDWGGETRNGEPVPGGVYVYLIDLLDYNGDEHRFTGMITLFR